MQPFDAGDYRRRVLASVHARGGADNSDPFEIYDIPLEEVDRLSDNEVAARIREVWAFWQKSRDHPRYRGVVLSMLSVHGQVSAALATRSSRLELRDRVRAERESRDGERFTEVDAAAARLMERFGGIPEDKLAGLTALAATHGIDADALTQRLRRYKVLPAGSPERSGRKAVPADVLRQIRSDLDELGRIIGSPAPASLFDLLGVPPGTPKAELRRVREELAARNRQRRPDRRRALVDDLLASVTALLIDGDQEAYLDALAATATERLRPRVGAAVLVEDQLLPEQYAAFVAEAVAAGCDPARARAVVDALAREHGVEPPFAPASPSAHRARPMPPVPTPVPRTVPPPVPPRPAHPSPTFPPPASGVPLTPRTPTPSSARPTGYAGARQAGAGQPGAGDWQAALSRARAALRARRPIAASDEVALARELAGETLPPIRAVSDEVETVIRTAVRMWEAVVPALAEGRHTEVLRQAEILAKTALDVPGPGGRMVDEVLSASRQRMDEADALVTRAQSASPEERESLLADALRLVVDHQRAKEALEAAGVEPPPSVDVRWDGGAVLVSWTASPTAGEIQYRVRRLAADGRARAVGVTSALSLSDGGVPGAGPLPQYEVSAGRRGIWSTPARWSPSAVPAPSPAPVTPMVPTPGAASGTASGPASGTASRTPSGTASRTPSGTASGPATPAAPPVPTAADVIPPATGLRVDGGMLRWAWPAGCTEMVVVWRADAPVSAADDPAGHARKVTNARYQRDGGVSLPPDRPLHVAVYACRRVDGGRLVVASTAAPSARMVLT